MIIDTLDTLSAGLEDDVRGFASTVVEIANREPQPYGVSRWELVRQLAYTAGILAKRHGLRARDVIVLSSERLECFIRDDNGGGHGAIQ